MATKAPDGPLCVLHTVHHPSVARNLQYSVGEQIVTVCPTGAVNLDMCVAYLMGQGVSPGHVGRSTWDLAQVRVTFLETQGNSLPVT